ncbi:MAG TPA: metal-dependent hydrolase [Polyangiaceae bacterium]|nr:metal-dependent hydrolase [Polyangiaceae bacterium]
MDNLTHALVGLLSAEAVVRVSERRRVLHPWTRTAIYALAIIGNNLPDLDFSYAGISGERFGYLLQHRGYTHTVLAAFVFAFAMLAVLWGASRWRAKQLPATDWWLLSLVALVSPLLHLTMDFANNYGVHPFWPLYSGWFYGDSLFILEPSLWLVLIAPLAFSYRSKWLRVGLWLILGVALGALWYRPFVSRGHAVVFSLLTLTLLTVARKLSPYARMLVAGSGFLLLGVVFVLNSRHAKGIVREQAALAFPRARSVDIVVTPMPANPFCWSVLLVQQEGATYVVRLGHAATWPAWLDVSSCPGDQDASPSAPLRALTGPNNARLTLLSEYRVSLSELQTLMRSRCEARGFARFARVPYVTAPAADGTRVLGDLRYDRHPGLDFSDLLLAEREHECPQYVPAWLPPRADLL